jgi:hypothetical protein
MVGPLRTAHASSVHMRHPLGVYCHMQKYATSILASNTATYAPHGARRCRAVSRMAGGAVLVLVLAGASIQELEHK